MEPQDLALVPTIGLIGGLTIQFAEGRWTGRTEDEIGNGVAVSEAAFDLIEPCIRAACSEWTDMHRYGVFELPIQARASLSKRLRSQAKLARDEADARKNQADLFEHVADWLDARCEERPISILGL